MNSSVLRGWKRNIEYWVSSYKEYEYFLLEYEYFLLEYEYLRDRKRVSCVYRVIMYAENVGRIREQNTLFAFQHFSSAFSQNKASFSIFYNRSRRYYVVNSFTIKTNFAIFLICTKCRHAQNCDSKVGINCFVKLEMKNNDTQINLLKL